MRIVLILAALGACATTPQRPAGPACRALTELYRQQCALRGPPCPYVERLDRQLRSQAPDRMEPACRDEVARMQAQRRGDVPER